MSIGHYGIEYNKGKDLQREVLPFIVSHYGTLSVSVSTRYKE